MNRIFKKFSLIALVFALCLCFVPSLITYADGNADFGGTPPSEGNHPAYSGGDKPAGHVVHIGGSGAQLLVRLQVVDLEKTGYQIVDGYGTDSPSPASNCSPALDSTGSGKTKPVFFGTTLSGSSIGESLTNANTMWIFDSSTGSYKTVGDFGSFTTNDAIKSYFGVDSMLSQSALAYAGPIDMKTQSKEDMAKIIVDIFGGNPDDFNLEKTVLVVEPFITVTFSTDSSQDPNTTFPNGVYPTPNGSTWQFHTAMSYQQVVCGYSDSVLGYDYTSHTQTAAYTALFGSQKDGDAGLGAMHQTHMYSIDVTGSITAVGSISPNNRGYVMYGPGINDIDPEVPVLSTVVMYYGEPTTNDSSKFKVYTETNFTEGSVTEGYKFWDGEKWVEPTSLAESVNLKGVNFEGYSVVMHDIGTIKLCTNYESDFFENYKSIDNALASAYDTSDFSVEWGEYTASRLGISASKEYGTATSIATFCGDADMEDVLIDAFLAMNKASSLHGLNSYEGSLMDSLPDPSDVPASAVYGVSKACVYSDSCKTSTGYYNVKLAHSALLVVKGSDITSRLVVIDASTGTIKEDTPIEYTSASFGVATLPSNASSWVIYKNGNAPDVNQLASKLKGVDNGNAAYDVCKQAGTIEDGSTHVPESVALGQEDNEGFTIVCVLTTPGDLQGSTVMLPDYMLNKYYSDIINYTSKTNSVVEIKPNISRYSIGSAIKANCVISCGYDTSCEGLTSEYVQDYTRNYNIVYKDVSSIGSNIKIDSGNLTGKYLLGSFRNPNSSNNTWDKWIRSNSVGGVSLDTNVLVHANKRLDYGLNLIRSAVSTSDGGGTPDARYLSSLSYTSLESIKNPHNVLKLNYGSTPAVVLEASAKRNSGATVGTLQTQELKFEAVFQQTNMIYGSYICTTSTGCTIAREEINGIVVSNGAHEPFSHTHDHLYYYDCGTDCNTDTETCEEDHCKDCTDDECTGDCCSGHSVPADCNGDHEGHAFYSCGKEVNGVKVEGHLAIGFHKHEALGILTNNGSPSNNITYRFRTGAYKYSSDVLDKGVNSKTSIGTGQVTALKPNANGVVPLLTSANGYRYGVIKNHNGSNGTTNVVLKFYPEVMMFYQHTNNAYLDSASLTTLYSAWTMGEYKRELQPSSLYLYRIRGTATGANNAKGTVYSDSMQGGSATLGGGNKPIIPAGADVSLMVDTKGIKIDCYGYSLDLITPDTQLANNIAYNSIIASGEDIYTSWGNSGSRTALQTDFQTWVNSVTNVEDYQADIKLKIGAKEYGNFSTTIGSIKGSGGTAQKTVVEDGAFAIEVANGGIVKNDGYYDFIRQLAADYVAVKPEQPTEAELQLAEEIFRNSGLYDSILDAIESSNSSFNNSQSVTTSNYNSAHWYDERVKTFVIRRYTCLGSYFDGITLEDKVDYGAAANSGSSGANTSVQNYNDASWNITLYRNKALDGVDYYTNNSSPNKPINTMQVIVNKVPIDGADFRVPSSTTSDYDY